MGSSDGANRSVKPGDSAVETGAGAKGERLCEEARRQAKRSGSEGGLWGHGRVPVRLSDGALREMGAKCGVMGLQSQHTGD